MTARWKLVTYDVWGNEEDGFQVNDEWPQGFIDCPENPTDEEVLVAVDATQNVQIADWADFGEGRIELEDKNNGKPLGYIYKVNLPKDRCTCAEPIRVAGSVLCQRCLGNL